MIYRITRPAREQIVEILARSTIEHGQRRAANYQTLLEAAMDDVGDNPRRPGARPVRRLAEVWCYDLRYTTNRLPPERRVRDPWHTLAIAWMKTVLLPFSLL